MSTINLEHEIMKENATSLNIELGKLNEQANLDAEVEKVLRKADATYRQDLMAELGFDYKLAEAQKIKDEREQFAALPGNRIMSLNAIKATCLKYGLRFLPTRYYRGALDEGIGPKLEDFKKLMGGKLPIVHEPEAMNSGAFGGGGKPQMYIAAPSASFHLQPVPKDPLLFCRLSADKFFLIHKWGADLTKEDIEGHGVRWSNWNSPTVEVDRSDYARMMALYNGDLNSLDSSTIKAMWNIGTSGLNQNIGTSQSVQGASLNSIWSSSSST